MHLAYLNSDTLNAGETARLTRSGVLVVGAEPRRLQDGAVLSFGLDDGKVIFHYSARSAQDSPLKLSSRLLALARPVK